MNKKKALAKFVRVIPADELRKVSGGVNADDEDRQEIVRVIAPVNPAVPVGPR
jgi:hypothetical protein